ncbi:Bug family tripartite tricarboxylate transporter substrate binding protein [Ottowia thiooxydans]|uniref:Bug family tripartite tricarboxylate transporter substrate binding protein n=1 Tax=Ottowia thiooxydans TaxID=219182 RepID=UPI00041EDE77|nr:tripartite tricarboxylate transporter substrate binding protein [Ottowia thiooxydans]
MTISLHRRRLLRAGLAVGVGGAGALAVTSVARAATFPTRTVNFVVPYGAGGPFDITARLVAERMSKQLGQTVVVDNRSGAGGMIGCTYVARAPADGYTLLLGGLTTHILMQGAVETMPFDPMKDFTVASLLSKMPLVMVVNNDLPVKDLRGLADLLRNNPGKYDFASAGNGTSGHILAQNFVDSIGAKAVHVPYRNSVNAYTDLRGGRIAFMVQTSGSSEMRAGVVRPLAVFSDKRSPAMPQLPTVAEAGLADRVKYNLEPWQAVMVRKGTPPEIIAQLNAAVTATLADPGLQSRFDELGFVATPAPVAQGERYFHEENRRWVPIVKAMDLVGR